MKILIAGDWHSDIHETPLARELSKLNAEVIEFRWCRYFQSDKSASVLQKAFVRFQNQYIIGPRVSQLNRDILRLLKDEEPDVLFLYRGTHIFPKTLQMAKSIRPDLRIVSYNNDNPFAIRQKKVLWRHHLRGIRFSDLVLAYRPKNVEDYRKLTDAEVEVFPPFFDDEVHFPANDTSLDKKEFDCVFIGHYEDDFRLECIKGLIDAGLKVGLYGDSPWNQPLRSAGLGGLTPVQLIWGSDYRQILHSSLVALCFFSKLNEDVYTRRCFEIPACGVALCSEYSPEMADLFKEGEEAFFFRTAEELIETMVFLKNNPYKALEVATKGREAIVRNEGSIRNRAEQLLVMIDHLFENSESVTSLEKEVPMEQKARRPRSTKQ